MIELPDHLTDEQVAAIRAREHHVAIVAGPGSGKTEVMRWRIVHFAKLFPRIPFTVATFTTAAADEVERRLRAFRIENTRYTGTLHALAYRILKDSGVSFVVVEREINDSEEEKDLAAGGKLTFRMMIRKATDLLRMGAGSRLSLPSRALFIDEFQDLTEDEFRFAVALTPSFTYIVGDPYQCIYQFKGARDNFPDAKRIWNSAEYRLTVNHRSSDEVIASANFVLREYIETDFQMRGTGKSGVALCTESPEKVIPYIATAEDMSRAILVGQNAAIPEWISLLIDLRIPFTTTSRQSIYHPSKRSDLLLMMKALLHYKRRRSLPKKVAAKVLALAKKHSLGRIYKDKIRRAELPIMMNHIRTYLLPLLSCMKDSRQVWRDFIWVYRMLRRGADNPVVLSTVHTAKGREWDFVVVDDRDLDPDLTLYVAVTRARHTLIVCGYSLSDADSVINIDNLI